MLDEGGGGGGGGCYAKIMDFSDNVPLMLFRSTCAGDTRRTVQRREGCLCLSVTNQQSRGKHN